MYNYIISPHVQTPQSADMTPAGATLGKVHLPSIQLNFGFGVRPPFINYIHVTQCTLFSDHCSGLGWTGSQYNSKPFEIHPPIYPLIHCLLITLLLPNQVQESAGKLFQQSTRGRNTRRTGCLSITGHMQVSHKQRHLSRIVIKDCHKKN